MNKIFKILPYFFGTAFIIFLFLSSRIMIQTPFLSGEADDTAKEVKYHYAFFLSAADHSFFSKVKEGAIYAGKFNASSATFALKALSCFFLIDVKLLLFFSAGFTP